MSLTLPSSRSDLPKKIDKRYHQLIELTNALNQKELPESFTSEINELIGSLNLIKSEDNAFSKKLSNTKQTISNRMIKELKLVPKGYYQTLWTELGMTVFGVPFGVMFGAALDNMAFLGIGLPIGLAIGIGIGNSLDQKAAKEGRQVATGSSI